MKITENNYGIDDQVHIIDSPTDTWSLIRKIANSEMQEDAFYVLDVGDVVRKHKIWKEKLPRVDPHYAVKCNDSAIILEVLAALGTGFDCASKGEINKVLSMGVNADRIIFANPAKQASHIRHAASVGVAKMTFDSEVELHKIKQFYPNAQLVIRIRCDAADAQCQLGMKFGCDAETEAPELLRIAKSLNLNVIGVSFHVGSGCREPQVFRRAIAASHELFEFAETVGYQFSLLDIGGGYPGDKNSTIDELADIINSALDDFFPDPNVEIIAEPGRFYVCSAFTLACNIYSIRNVCQSDGTENDINGNPMKVHRMYFINDGVYGSFNCILYDHQVVVPKPLNDYSNTKLYSSSIWGPTCDGLDQVIEEVKLPEMSVGDWLIFEDMGAYTLPVASSFNGFPIPKVHIVVEDNIWMLLKDNMAPFNDSHFQMLTKPASYKMRPDPMRNNAELIADFPIRIQMPLCSGESIMREHVLDYVDVGPID